MIGKISTDNQYGARSDFSALFAIICSYANIDSLVYMYLILASV